MIPDYKKYTLVELYDVKANIDKGLYPERYSLLLSEIKLKEQNPDERAESSSIDQEVKVAILKKNKKAIYGSVIHINFGV